MHIRNKKIKVILLKAIILLKFTIYLLKCLCTYFVIFHILKYLNFTFACSIDFNAYGILIGDIILLRIMLSHSNL